MEYSFKPGDIVGSVAQLGRAVVSKTIGRGFESSHSRNCKEG